MLGPLQTIARKTAELKLDQWTVPEVKWGNRGTELAQECAFVSRKWNGNISY